MTDDVRQIPEYSKDDLPGTWFAADESDLPDLVEELRREAPRGHALHDTDVVPVLVRRLLKDVIFWVPDRGEWALVHLTWSVETDPQWPSCTLTSNWSTIVRELADDSMRDLTDTERGVLALLLAEDFPGADALRAQLGAVRVSGGCDCGCPTINLDVEGDVPLAVVESRTPVNAHVDGVLGGGLIVFVDDGRLSSLEYYSSEDTPPSEFPALEQVRPYL